MIPFKIYTQKRIFNYYTGMSFFIFIWISKIEKDEARLTRHEVIHFWQQVEMLFVFHWFLYASFYIFSRIRGHAHYLAYRNNPFELEAYEHDFDVCYLQKRRPYAWVGFIKKYYNGIGKKASFSSHCSKPSFEK